jgi:monothiol glutaredoxin
MRTNPSLHYPTEHSKIISMKTPPEGLFRINPHQVQYPMNKPEITAYLKTMCGWSNGVRAVFAKYELPYTEKDIIKNPAFRWEMEQRSGQPLSPCVEVNGVMLADISGEEVEQYLLQNALVHKNDAEVGVPLNAPCTDAQHAAMMRGEPVSFRPN